MKQFENWNKSRGIDFRIRFSSAKQFGAYIEQEREDAWEAALKWVLGPAQEGCYDADSWYSNIEEELNGEADGN